MKYASQVKHMRVGDLYVSMGADDRQPFWRTKAGLIMTLANDGSVYQLSPSHVLPAVRFYKNYRSQED